VCCEMGGLLCCSFVGRCILCVRVGYVCGLREFLRNVWFRSATSSDPDRTLQRSAVLFHIMPYRHD
jgi:hypothetical protein